MLGHTTEQVQPETAAGALSGSACSVWRLAAVCLSRISVCLLPAAATAGCLSQLWQREAHADAHSVALCSLPPVCVCVCVCVCVNIQQVFRSGSCLHLAI